MTRRLVFTAATAAVAMANTAAAAEAPSEMPLLPITSTETLAKAAALELRAGDVFVASYPKSGTTWMQAIVVSLLSAGEHPTAGEHISDFAPFFEIDATWADDGTLQERYSAGHEQLGHRVFNTHLRWSQMPKTRDEANVCTAKYIYLVRDGRDAVTSFFHHLGNQDGSGGYSGTFEAFFDDWLAGTLPYGRWVDHVDAWLSTTPEQLRANNVLAVHYDDLKADLLGSLLTIAEFLEVPLSAEEIESQVLPKVTFKYMKANGVLYQPVSVQWKPGFDFIRKGQTGDHKNLLSDDQRARYSAVVAETHPIGADWLREEYM